ncbi:MAG: hypothetical protein O7B35_05410 [Deltaproteobacteria bacterium]|nr:hypothetical protein [Deltaproteobacteria bacterium]
MKENKDPILAEEKRLKRLRRIVDFTATLLWQANLTLSDAQKLVADARKRALELFPDKGETFDLIYGSRFRRILAEKYQLQ